MIELSIAYRKLKTVFGNEAALAILETLESIIREIIHPMKKNLIKWMFAFWVGQLISLGGLLFGLLKHLGIGG